MNTPLLYSIVPIAPSKTMTCCGSRSRAISGFSGNGCLRFTRSACAGAAHRVVLGFRMMDDHRCRRLLGEKLERFSEIHAERFLRGKKLENCRMIVEIGTGTIAPGISLSAWHAKLLPDAPVRPLGNSFRGLDREAM